MTNRYQPTRQGAKHQLNQLMAVLNGEPLSTGAQIKIGSAAQFLQECYRTLPSIQQSMRRTKS